MVKKEVPAPKSPEFGLLPVRSTPAARTNVLSRPGQAPDTYRPGNVSSGSVGAPVAWSRKGRDMAEQEFTDAVALLKADHREVEQLFAAFENASGTARKEKLAREICTELKIHTMIEEEIFYPAFEGKIEQDILDEAYVEHDGAKLLINDIEAAEPDEAFYDAKVKVLSEEIEHHVKEEERPAEGMFAQCRETDVDLVELRDRMAARKEELIAQADGGELPPAEVRTLDAA